MSHNERYKKITELLQEVDPAHLSQRISNFRLMRDAADHRGDKEDSDDCQSVILMLTSIQLAGICLNWQLLNKIDLLEKLS